MSRVFSHETRVLACSSCGAPLEAMLRGGTVLCRYCGATNLLAARVERPAFPTERAEPLDEAERTRRLRAQDGEPAVAPDSIRGLLAEDDSIPAWKVQEAISVWQSARVEVGEVGSYEAAERLLFLTSVLGAHFEGQGEPLRQRAMLESALEVFTLPRHLQIARGHLARSAVRAGDMEAAERWLAPCDARSDDLQTDSAYRHARALLDTLRGDARAVLTTLGAQADQVPLVAGLGATATLLRAHAMETLGERAQAVDLLAAAMQRGQRGGLDQARAGCGIPALCLHSYPEAARAHRAARAEAIRGSASGGTARMLIWMAWLFGLIAAGLIAAGVLCLAIALVSMIAPALVGGGEAAWFAGGTVAFSLAVTGVSLIGPGIGMLFTAAVPGWIGHRIRSRALREAERIAQGLDRDAEVIDS